MVKQSEEKLIEENIVPNTEIHVEKEVPSNVSDPFSKDIVEEKRKPDLTDFDRSEKERKFSSSSSESSDDKDQEEGLDKSEDKKRKGSSSSSDDDYFEAVGEPEIDVKQTDHNIVPEVVEEREERVVSPVSPIRGPEKDFKRAVSPVQEPEVDLKLESQILKQPADTDLDSFYEGSKIQEPEYDIEFKPEGKSLQFEREVGVVDPEVTYGPESQISLESRETDIDFSTAEETFKSKLSEVKVRPPEVSFHENIPSQFTSEVSEEYPEQDPAVIDMKDKSLEMKDEEQPFNKSETLVAKPADEGHSEKTVKDSKKLHVTFAESVIDNERISVESDTTESESSESDTDSDSSTEGSKYLRDVQMHKEKVYRSSSDSDSEREGAYDVEGARKLEMVTDIDAVDNDITEEVTSFRSPDVENEFSSLPDSQTPKLKYEDDGYIVEENVEFLRKSPLTENTQGHRATDLDNIDFDSGDKNVKEEKSSLSSEGDDNIDDPSIDTKSSQKAADIDTQIESPSENSSSDHDDERNVDKKDRFVSENQTRKDRKEEVKLKPVDTEFVDSDLAIPPGNEIEFKIDRQMDLENVQFIEISKKPAAQTNVDDISEKPVYAADDRKSYEEMSPNEIQVTQPGEISRRESTPSSESSDTDDGIQGSRVKDESKIPDEKPVQSKETNIDDVLAEKTIDDFKEQSISVSPIEGKEKSCEIKEEIQPEIVVLETVTARHSEIKETSLSPEIEEYTKEPLADELHLGVHDKYVRKDNVAVETPANLDLDAKSLDIKENVAELIEKDDRVEVEDDEKDVIFSKPNQYGQGLTESAKPNITDKIQRRPSDTSSSESDENESKAAQRGKQLTYEDEEKLRNDEDEPVDIKEAKINERRLSSSSSSSFEKEYGESGHMESKKQYGLPDKSHLQNEMETNRVESFIIPDRPKTIDIKEEQRKGTSKGITSRQSRSSSSSSESGDVKESQKAENISEIPITKSESKSPVKESDVDNVPLKNASLEDDTDDNIKARSRNSSSSSSSSEDNVKHMPVVETDIDSVLQEPKKTFETDLDAAFEENNKQDMEGPIITELDDYPVPEEPVDYTIPPESDIGAVKPEYVMEQYHTAIPVESPRDKQGETEIPKDEVYCETTLTVVRRVKVKQSYDSDKTERQPTAIEQNLGKKYDQPKIEDVTEADKQHGKRSRSPSWSFDDDDDHPIKRLDSQERFHIDKETAPPAREYITVETNSKLDKSGEVKEENLIQKPYVPKESSASSSSSSSSKSADEGEFRVQEYPEESGIVLV